MTGFFMAWTMFWIIPCPCRKWDNNKYSQMLVWMPAIGLLIGGLWTLLAFLVGLGNGLGMFGPALLAALPTALTGFIHLDGYMDCSDAVLSHRDLEGRLRILKDSHVGAFAVIMVVLWALINYSLMSTAALFTGSVWARMFCLIFIPAAVRCCSAIAVMAFRPLATSGYSASHENVRPANIWALVIQMVIYAAVPVVIYGVGGLCVLCGIAGSWLAILYLRHNLGGMSGDISGAAIVFGEVCAVAGLAFIG